MPENDKIDAIISGKYDKIQEFVDIGLDEEFAKQLVEQDEERKQYYIDKNKESFVQRFPKHQEDEYLTDEPQEEGFDIDYLSNFFGDGLDRD